MGAGASIWGRGSIESSPSVSSVSESFGGGSLWPMPTLLATMCYTQLPQIWARPVRASRHQVKIYT